MRGKLDGMVDLPLIDGYADDLAANKFGYLSCWAADAAANIEDFHAWPETHEEGETVFVEVHCGLDSIVWGEGSVVEVCAPP